MKLREFFDMSDTHWFNLDDHDIYESGSTASFRLDACGRLLLGGDPVDMDITDLLEMDVYCWGLHNGELEVGVIRQEPIEFLERQREYETTY